MDKKSYMLGLEEKAKVLILSGEKSKSICQPGNQESVTIIECINGDRVVISFFVIWAAKTYQNAKYLTSLPTDYQFATITIISQDLSKTP